MSGYCVAFKIQTGLVSDVNDINIHVCILHVYAQEASKMLLPHDICAKLQQIAQTVNGRPGLYQQSNISVLWVFLFILTHCTKAHISDVLAMAHQGGSTTIVDHLIR